MAIISGTPELTRFLMTMRLRPFKHHRIKAAACLLFVLWQLAPAAGFCESPASREGLAVIFLIDRSPSAGSRQEGEEYLIDDLAGKLRDQVFGLAERYEVALYFGAINFGGHTGNPKPLARVEGHTFPVLPQREVISYTDFRPAFKYALEQFELHERLNDAAKSIVVLITDSEPWPGTRLGEDDKKEYFNGDGRFQDSFLPSVAGAISKIREAGGEIIVLAVQDHAGDAKLWRDHIPPENYISTRESSNPLAECRHLLTRIIEQARGETVTEGPRPTTARAAPSNPRRGEGAAFPDSTKLLVGLLASTVVNVYLLWVVAIQKKEIRARVSGYPESVGEVQELKEQAREALAEENKEKAKEFYEEALMKIVDRGREADQTTKNEISGLFSEMLHKLCGTVEEERRLITELLGKSPENDLREREKIAKGMATVVLQRWAKHPEFLLLEFDLFRTEPLGNFFLEGFSEIPASPEAEIGEASFQDAVQHLAKSARDLYVLVGA